MTVENLEINVSKVGDAAATSLGKLSKNVEQLKESSDKSTGALGKLAASIKRIAFYRVLRSALKNVTKAFDEGLKNAYHFSEAVGYGLATTMDTIATKSLTMKNQMGAAFGGLIQAVEPILLRIISLITQAANAIAAFFGALNGGTYLKAKDTATAWNEATSAANAYKRTILGFDEINKLDENSGGVNAMEMFEERTIPENMLKVLGYVDKIRDSIENIGNSASFKAIVQFLKDIVSASFDISLNLLSDAISALANSFAALDSLADLDSYLLLDMF